MFAVGLVVALFIYFLLPWRMFFSIFDLSELTKINVLGKENVEYLFTCKKDIGKNERSIRC